jgi:hypothetical protein
VSYSPAAVVARLALHQFHSSSASRVTAGASGFLTLIQQSAHGMPAAPQMQGCELLPQFCSASIGAVTHATRTWATKIGSASAESSRRLSDEARRKILGASAKFAAIRPQLDTRVSNFSMQA